MSNPKVREEVKNILRFWLDMGVDGFREDVITYIAKTPGLPSVYPKLPAANGMQHYTNRPDVHTYLAEFKRDVLDGYDCFIVGESPMTNINVALKYVTEGKNKVMDEMIDFFAHDGGLLSDGLCAAAVRPQADEEGLHHMAEGP